MKKVLKFLGIGIVGIIVLAVVFGGKSSKPATNQSGNQATPMAAIKVSATQLADDFDSNQVSAEDKWKGKLVQLSAKITNITDSGLSFANVASKDFSLAQISCRIQDKQQLLPLKNGQTVTVKGIIGKQTLGVIDMSDCEIVTN